MCYITAKEVLPKEVIELIQKYVDGEYIYIPRKETNKREWGAKTSTRGEIKLRNESIYAEYMDGLSRQELAEKYFLSKKSIDRIILKEKSK
ncbi:CD3324 family protein [Clostridium sp. LIBA-8841]|uniref:CD3324 family protein n=1 Tax=Clostridium sp. LIBA-8841 TaxID=2987530 RepID=UPI002AC6CE76|nr:CD3324 family protein [Clostridium sp. LIBA-8841]MDZ5253998.1 CD3324 family protein [Clostridium sp. LIBA-8841]